MSDDQLLEQLLPNSECDWLEWKADFPGGFLKPKTDPEWDKAKGTVLKDLISLANGEGQPTAYLVYGVKEIATNRQVTGICKSWDDSVFQLWCQNVFDPPPKFHYAEVDLLRGRVGLFVIERVPGYPHVAKTSVGSILFEGQVWYRMGSKNTVALHDDLVRMVKGEQPFCFDSSMDEKFKELLVQLKTEGQEPVIPRVGQKDSYLSQGYRIAHYPNTRREIWVGELHGRYEGIVMLRTRK
jgi:hypothetical protein